MELVCKLLAGTSRVIFFLKDKGDLQKAESHLRELLAARDLRSARGAMYCLLGTEGRRIITVLSFLIAQVNMSLIICF